MAPTSTSATPSAATAVSGHLDTRTAGMELAEQLQRGIGSTCDLALFFASFHHRAAFEEAVTTVRHTINPRVMLGVTTESVLADDKDLEGLAGMSAIALQLPGATLHPWRSTPDDPIRISHPETIPDRIGLTREFRAAIMLADPFSTPMTRLLPALTGAGDRGGLQIVGGMASGAGQAGHNALLLNDQMQTAGAVGVSIGGNVAIDTVLSQGCRPIGSPMVVTKAHKNVILELGGRKAMEELQSFARDLSDDDKRLLGGGLLIGSVIDEQRPHWGRGDFLVRNILGFDNRVGGIVAGDLPRVGQTVQFHVRDAQTAVEDLQLLLDAQQLHQRPFAALLFSCNSRGRRLFEDDPGDAMRIQERLGPMPMAGFFAAGEIGPVGTKSFLHGHTASLVLFRKLR